MSSQIPPQIASSISVPTTSTPATISAPPLPVPPSLSSKKSPSDFLKQVLGRPVMVKLNNGADFRGVLVCLDGFMNIAMEQSEEYVDNQLKNKYGDCFFRGNKFLIPFSETFSPFQSRFNLRMISSKNDLNKQWPINSESFLTPLFRQRVNNEDCQSLINQTLSGLTENYISPSKIYIDKFSINDHTPGDIGKLFEISKSDLTKYFYPFDISSCDNFEKAPPSKLSEKFSYFQLQGLAGRSAKEFQILNRKYFLIRQDSYSFVQKMKNITKKFSLNSSSDYSEENEINNSVYPCCNLSDLKAASIHPPLPFVYQQYDDEPLWEVRKESYEKRLGRTIVDSSGMILDECRDSVIQMIAFDRKKKKNITTTQISQSQIIDSTNKEAIELNQSMEDIKGRTYVLHSPISRCGSSYSLNYILLFVSSLSLDYYRYAYQNDWLVLFFPDISHYTHTCPFHISKCRFHRHQYIQYEMVVNFFRELKMKCSSQLKSIRLKDLSLYPSNDNYYIYDPDRPDEKMDCYPFIPSSQATLFDLVEYGTQNYGSAEYVLPYFWNEIQQVDELPVLVAIDGVNIYDNTCRYGDPTRVKHSELLTDMDLRYLPSSYLFFLNQLMRIPYHPPSNGLCVVATTSCNQSHSPMLGAVSMKNSQHLLNSPFFPILIPPYNQIESHNIINHYKHSGLFLHNSLEGDWNVKKISILNSFNPSSIFQWCENFMY